MEKKNRINNCKLIYNCYILFFLLNSFFFCIDFFYFLEIKFWEIMNLVGDLYDEEEFYNKFVNKKL